MCLRIFLFLSAVLAVLACVNAHGRVLDPPSRASAWRSGFSTRANYDDDGLNCGGFYHQHSVNGGKCGICGDPYDAATPRAHELGGTYGDGVIVSSYQPGQLLTVTVEISAYHRGYWEFKICPDQYNNEQDCFDQYPLELEEGGTQYYPTQSAKYTINYRLPAGLSCEHCVLQWRYTAGNNWGDCRNGTQGLGCGDQEQFGACSDISIQGAQTFGAFVDTASQDVPSPLFYYLTNGIFDEQQGLLHLLWKGMMRPHQLIRKPARYENQMKKRKKNNKKKNKPHRWKKMPQFR